MGYLRAGVYACVRTRCIWRVRAGKEFSHCTGRAYACACVCTRVREGTDFGSDLERQTWCRSVRGARRVMDEPVVLENTSSASEPVTSPEPVSSSQVASAPASGAVSGGDSGFTSIRDYAAGLGLADVVSQHRDDESFVNFLVQQHRHATQAQHLTPYAQRYLQHANAFEQFLQQQQAQQAQQQQPQRPKFWNPPEYNPHWSRFVARDEQGNFALVPGAGGTPDVIPKVAAYEQYVRDFVHRFTNNPQETLTPLINEVVQPLLEQQLGQYMASLQERQTARDFIAGNNNWLYAEQGGHRVRDADGHLMLSENGQLFSSLVQEAEQLGLDTVQKQQRYAARVLSAAGRYGIPTGVQQAEGPAQVASQPQSVNNQLKQQFLHRPNPAGAIGLSSQTPQPTQDNMQLSLADILRRNLAAGGINDAALAADFR